MLRWTENSGQKRHATASSVASESTDDLLHLSAGAKVGLAVDNGRLVVEPQARPRYTLDELLAQCDASAEPTAEDGAWLDARPVGSELL